MGHLARAELPGVEATRTAPCFARSDWSWFGSCRGWGESTGSRRTECQPNLASLLDSFTIECRRGDTENNVAITGWWSEGF